MEEIMTRVAVVTGGTRGIGRAICEALRDAGYDVASNYAGNDEAAKKFEAETGLKLINLMSLTMTLVRRGSTKSWLIKALSISS